MGLPVKELVEVLEEVEGKDVGRKLDGPDRSM
jgi:hypothetical protein